MISVYIMLLEMNISKAKHVGINKTNPRNNAIYKPKPLTSGKKTKAKPLLSTKQPSDPDSPKTLPPKLFLATATKWQRKVYKPYSSSKHRREPFLLVQANTTNKM